MPINVLLVDDHAVLRDGLSNIISLEEDMEVVGQASSGAEALLMIEELQPDVVLMDINMPGMSGVEAIRRIRAKDQKVAVLVLTMFDRDEYLYESIRAGATGYLLKDAPSSDVIDAIRSASRGRVHPSSGDGQKAVGQYQRRQKDGPGLQRGFTHSPGIGCSQSDGERAVQQGDRRTAVYQRQNCQDPCEQHIEKVTGQEPFPGDYLCDSARVGVAGLRGAG